MTTTEAMEKTSAIYAELVAKHKRPLSPQPGDIQLTDFAHDISSTIDVARSVLDAEVAAGRLVKLKRSSSNNRQMTVYRLPDD